MSIVVDILNQTLSNAENIDNLLSLLSSSLLMDIFLNRTSKTFLHKFLIFSVCRNFGMFGFV